jgi:2-dehydropantoate 2-reductase
MRVAIIGAGAMGGIFGAALTEADLDTALVDVSGPLVDRLNADGLTIVQDGKERRITVRAVSDPAALGVVDVALFLVKAYHTEAAASFASPLVGPGTVVASLQNGWGHGDVLASHCPASPIVLGVTYNSGTVLEPGRVMHGQPRKGKCIVGPFTDDRDEAAGLFARTLDRAGFPTEIVQDIRVEIWRKLVVTAAANAVSALTGYGSRALGEDPPLGEVVDSLVREVVAVANAAGYHLDEDERLRETHEAIIAAGDGKASMLQDLEAGRRTEIDAINGAVVREAETQGIDVPINKTILALVKGYETAHGLAGR